MDESTGNRIQTDSDFHPVICVGAMDEYIFEDGTYRRKASYSNGPGIDVFYRRKQRQVVLQSRWIPGQMIIIFGI